MHLREFDRWMRDLLRIDNFTDIDSSRNGLQVDRVRQEIGRVAFAVDASMESFRRASDAGSDLLFVHHGLFWGDVRRICDGLFSRIRFLIEKDLGLYGVHLPLDSHPEYGNNAALAGMLDMEDVQPFGEYKGVKIGCKGRLPEPLQLEEIDRKLGSGESGESVVLPFGSTSIRTVGIVSGASPKSVVEAARDGLDLFLSGEPSHMIYHECLEAGINAIFAGHYRTETGGVGALSDYVGRNSDIETLHIEIPTGL